MSMQNKNTNFLLQHFSVMFENYQFSISIFMLNIFRSGGKMYFVDSVVIILYFSPIFFLYFIDKESHENKDMKTRRFGNVLWFSNQ